MSHILFLESKEAPPLPDFQALGHIYHGLDFAVVTNVEAAIKLASHDNPLIIVSNFPYFELFDWRRKHQPEQCNILVTTEPMASYSRHLKNQEERVIDHIISHRLASFWSHHDLRITIEKVLNPDDIFGIAKYLGPGTQIQQFAVTGSKDREILNNEILKFSLSCRLGQHTAKIAFGICEELLMNAIHDAPLAAGIEYYMNLERTQPVDLRPSEYGKLTFGCDGRILAIATEDPLGVLQKTRLFQYLKKVIRRHESTNIIDTKAGGAGLGFFKILYSSHGIVCNVEDRKRTEVIALIDTTEHIRDFAHMPRSIHFFNAAQMSSNQKSA